MEKLISFLLYFLIIYLLYLITVVLKKEKYEKYKRGKQVLFFIKKYNVDFKKVSFERFINVLSIINSFIMATTIMIVRLIITDGFMNNIIIKLSIAFVVLMFLIIVCYSVYGKILERRSKHV